MSRKPGKTKITPEMLIKQPLYRTKKFFHKTFRSFKSLLLGGYQKLPKTPNSNHTFSLSAKLQEVDSSYTSSSEKWDSNEVDEKTLLSEEQKKGDEKCSSKGPSSMSVAGGSGLKYSQQEEKKYPHRTTFKEPILLARKMKELEMMDVNDVDQVLDIEEVLHYYSRLTCPAYLDIVDRFFMDMYSEFQLPQASRSAHSSMRKLGSATASVHGSMRSLGPIRL